MLEHLFANNQLHYNDVNIYVIYQITRYIFMKPPPLRPNTPQSTLTSLYQFDGIVLYSILVYVAHSDGIGAFSRTFRAAFAVN